MEQKRNISLEQDFMNYNIDDILWGMILVKATYNPQIKQLYITDLNLIEVKRDYTRGIGVTARTTRNRVQKYIDMGMMEQKVMENTIIYTIKDKYTKYKLVDYYILKYLVTTKSHNAIKVYTYLLNCYDLKKGQDNMYSFTVRELLLALGYAETTANKGDNTTMISMILRDLKKTELIDFVEYYEDKAPRMRLTKVATKKEELKD